MTFHAIDQILISEQKPNTDGNIEMLSWRLNLWAPWLDWGLLVAGVSGNLHQVCSKASFETPLLEKNQQLIKK